MEEDPVADGMAVAVVVPVAAREAMEEEAEWMVGVIRTPQMSRC